MDKKINTVRSDHDNKYYGKYDGCGSCFVNMRLLLHFAASYTVGVEGRWGMRTLFAFPAPYMMGVHTHSFNIYLEGTTVWIQIVWREGKQSHPNMKFWPLNRAGWTASYSSRGTLFFGVLSVQPEPVTWHIKYFFPNPTHVQIWICKGIADHSLLLRWSLPTRATDEGGYEIADECRGDE